MKLNRFLTTILCGVLCAANAVSSLAQESTFKVTAPTIIQRPGGARLEGDRNAPARVQSPQLDVQAGVVAFDYVNNQITELRALSQAGHRVNIKVELSPQGGGAPARIEATADRATLNPQTRALLLQGNVDGFYQTAQSGRSTLSGETVNAKYEGESLAVTVEGGAKGVRLVIPPEALNQPGALGAVTLTAQRASFDRNGGVARLTGDARAVSSDGPHKFDVAANEFILTRAAGTNGTIEKLVTVGRTRLKIELPAEPAQSTPVESTPPARIGRPTRLEAVADAMTMTRPDNSLVFEGNVEGFYELSPASGATTSPRYSFAGDRAVVRYVTQPAQELAAGLNVEVTGKPSTIELPGFNLGF